MLNSIVLAGNLGEDPKITYLGDGSAVAKFSLAFHSNGKKEKAPGWIKIAAFKKLAEICQQYLQKGDKVAVSGILEQNSWEQDGVKRTSFQIIAHNVEFIKLKGNNQEAGNDEVPF